MAGLLTRFLRETCDRRWEWGVTDCLITPADWVLWVRGRDPAAQWRGTYSTEDECRAVVKRAGGMLAICEDGLSSVGIDRTDAPRMGDFALVRGMISRGGIPTPALLGSICVTEKDRAVMTDMGLIVSSIGFENVAAWRVI